MAGKRNVHELPSFMRVIAAQVWRDRRGVTAIEYAMIAGIMAIAVAGSLLPTVAPNFSNTFNTVSSEL